MSLTELLNFRKGWQTWSSRCPTWSTCSPTLFPARAKIEATEQYQTTSWRMSTSVWSGVRCSTNKPPMTRSPIIRTHDQMLRCHKCPVTYARAHVNQGSGMHLETGVFTAPVSGSYYFQVRTFILPACSCLKESLSVPRDRGPGSRGPGGDGAERGGDGAHVRQGLLRQQPEVRHVWPVHHCGHEGRSSAFSVFRHMIDTWRLETSSRLFWRKVLLVSKEARISLLVFLAIWLATTLLERESGNYLIKQKRNNNNCKNLFSKDLFDHLNELIK